MEPSGWREIPPLDFLIIFTIATHRFSYTFGAATFVNGLQLGYIRLYPDDPMPSSSTDTGSQPSDEPLPSVPNFTDVNFFRHDLTFGFFHGSYVPKFVQFSDHFPHFCPNFHVPIVFPSFFPTFSHHFPIIFHQFSTSFPPFWPPPWWSRPERRHRRLRQRRRDVAGLAAAAPGRGHSARRAGRVVAAVGLGEATGHGTAGWGDRE